MVVYFAFPELTPLREYLALLLAPLDFVVFSPLSANDHIARSSLPKKFPWSIILKYIILISYFSWQSADISKVIQKKKKLSHSH